MSTPQAIPSALTKQLSPQGAIHVIESATKSLDKIANAMRDIAQAKHELELLLKDFPVQCQPNIQILELPIEALKRFYWRFKIGTRKEN